MRTTVSPQMHCSSARIEDMCVTQGLCNATMLRSSSLQGSMAEEIT